MLVNGTCRWAQRKSFFGVSAILARGRASSIGYSSIKTVNTHGPIQYRREQFSRISPIWK
jgi:hypothetical protein